VIGEKGGVSSETHTGQIQKILKREAGTDLNGAAKRCYSGLGISVFAIFVIFCSSFRLRVLLVDCTVENELAGNPNPLDHESVIE
jgi:hypothetical protein